jgi:hypothetical protein
VFWSWYLVDIFSQNVKATNETDMLWRQRWQAFSSPVIFSFKGKVSEVLFKSMRSNLGNRYPNPQGRGDVDSKASGDWLFSFFGQYFFPLVFLLG